MANPLMVLAHAVAEHGAENGVHAEPTAFGLNVSWYVAAAMTVLILFAILAQRRTRSLVPVSTVRLLKSRKQLEEARGLRAEAEALRKEYSDKIANAERDAAAMIDHARQEAEAIVAKAEEDTTTVIARRERMASEKIEAAERTAVAELRATTAAAATRAARGLIAKKPLRRCGQGSGEPGDRLHLNPQLWRWQPGGAR